MKRDAEAHAAEDKKRREAIDLKNQGENLAYQTEKMLKEHGEKVAADIRGQDRERAERPARRAQERRRRPHQEDDGEPRPRSSHKLGEEMYKATSAPGGGGPESPPPKPRPTAARPAPGRDGKKKDDEIYGGLVQRHCSRAQNWRISLLAREAWVDRVAQHPQPVAVIESHAA